MRSFVVHGVDGIDEVSLCAETEVADVRPGLQSALPHFTPRTSAARARWLRRHCRRTTADPLGLS